MNTPQLLTLDEAADNLRCSRSTIYRLVSKGDLRTVHIGRKALVPAAEVSRYLSNLVGEAA